MKSFVASRESHRGFTLTELLMTIALVAVLAGLGVPSFQKGRINSNLDEVSTDLMLAVQQAQGQALKINRNVIVAPVTVGDWTSGWQVFVKLDSNNVYDDGADSLLTTREAMPGTLKVRAAPAPCDHFIVNSSGYAGSTNCRVVIGSAETGRYKHVLFARSGRTRVCTAASDLNSACPD